MPKVDEDSAKLALMELAEAFGSTDGGLIEHIVPGEKEMHPPDLLSIAMEGRIYLQDGKAVYRLRQEIDLLNGGTIAEFKMRSPSAKDFMAYSQGMVVSVSREGKTEIDMVMMAKRTIKAVAALADQPASVVERMGRKDLSDLTDIGDALGFFD